MIKQKVLYVLCHFAALGIIAAHQQTVEGLRFKVPLVPLVPALSILANVGLMVNLNPMTWVRFCIWMVIGNRIFDLFIRPDSKSSFFLQDL